MSVQITTDQTQQGTKRHMCILLVCNMSFQVKWLDFFFSFFFDAGKGNGAKMKKFYMKNSLKYDGGKIKALQSLNSQAACGISHIFIT